MSTLPQPKVKNPQKSCEMCRWAACRDYGKSKEACIKFIADLRYEKYFDK